MDRFQVQSCAFSKRNVRSYLVYMIAKIKCISIENEFTKSKTEQLYALLKIVIYLSYLESASDFNRYIYLRERLLFLRQEKGFQEGNKFFLFKSYEFTQTTKVFSIDLGLRYQLQEDN